MLVVVMAKLLAENEIANLGKEKVDVFTMMAKHNSCMGELFNPWLEEEKVETQTRSLDIIMNMISRILKTLLAMFIFKLPMAAAAPNEPRVTRQNARNNQQPEEDAQTAENR